MLGLETLGETLSGHEPGDEVTLRLLRDTEEVEVTVTLVDQPR